MGNDLIPSIQHLNGLQLFAFSLLSMHNEAIQTKQNVHRIENIDTSDTNTYVHR